LFENYQYCEFLEQHPLAINHRKSKYALIAHMKLNIDRYLQGEPFHHFKKPHQPCYWLVGFVVFCRRTQNN